MTDEPTFKSSTPLKLVSHMHQQLRVRQITCGLLSDPIGRLRLGIVLGHVLRGEGLVDQLAVRSGAARNEGVASRPPLHAFLVALLAILFVRRTVSEHPILDVRQVGDVQLNGQRRPDISAGLAHDLHGLNGDVAMLNCRDLDGNRGRGPSVVAPSFRLVGLVLGMLHRIAKCSRRADAGSGVRT